MRGHPQKAGVLSGRAPRFCRSSFPGIVSIAPRRLRVVAPARDCATRHLRPACSQGPGHSSAHALPSVAGMQSQVCHSAGVWVRPRLWRGGTGCSGTGGCDVLQSAATPGPSPHGATTATPLPPPPPSRGAPPCPPPRSPRPCPPPPPSPSAAKPPKPPDPCIPRMGPAAPPPWPTPPHSDRGPGRGPGRASEGPRPRPLPPKDSSGPRAPLNNSAPLPPPPPPPTPFKDWVDFPPGLRPNKNFLWRLHRQSVETTNHLEERLLDQAQARASYTPLFWGHSRSIPQGMILDVQPLVKSLFCPIRASPNGFFDFEASTPLNWISLF